MLTRKQIENLQKIKSNMFEHTKVVLAAVLEKVPADLSIRLLSSDVSMTPLSPEGTSYSISMKVEVHDKPKKAETP